MHRNLLECEALCLVPVEAMKTLLPAVVALSLLVGCSDPTASGEKVVTSPDSGEKVVTRWDNGAKKSEGHLLANNTKDGRWTAWHENGQMRGDGDYQNGKREGVWTFWHENGQKHREGEYKNGKREGSWASWYRNGQKCFEGERGNGKQEGPWTYWNKDGSIDAEKSGIYKADKKVAPLPTK